MLLLQMLGGPHFGVVRPHSPPYNTGRFLAGAPHNRVSILLGKARIVNAIRQILAAQFVLGIVAGIAAWLLFDAVAAYSAWLGGAICVIPNIYLAARMLAATPSGDAGRMWRSTWFGEIGKLILTAALFALAFGLVEPLSAGGLFAGFIAAQNGTWMAIMRSPDALN
ncbi:MAG: ATP synthase subunit I [Pseudomonadota bacterium]